MSDIGELDLAVDEEIESIQAVYCQPGECQVTRAGSTQQITLNLSFEIRNGVNYDVKLVLTMTETYPNSIPGISLISSHLPRDIVASVKQAVEQQAHNLIGQLMLFDVISLVQENLREKLTHITAKSDKDVNVDTKEDFIWTSLLHLDHMRSKNRYIKTIEKWTSELNLTGRLIFMGRLILILLQGNQKEIKEYVSRQRTVNVDIDSHGRSCKERMMSVLCEKKTTASKKFDRFDSVECKGIDEVENMFSSAGISEIFKEHVSSLQGKYF